MRMNARTGADAWQALRLTGEDIGRAGAMAVTDTLKGAETAIYEAMPERIQGGPERFTLRALRVRASRHASGGAMAGRLELRPYGRTAHYLVYGEYGMPRAAKGFERLLRVRGFLEPGDFLVPGPGAEVNRHGNLVPRFYQRALADLAVQGRGYRAASTAASRKRRARAGGSASGRFFMVRPGNAGGLRPGIWERRGQSLRAWLVVVRTAPVYRPLFGFRSLAREVAARDWPVNFQRRLGDRAARKGPPGRGV